MDLRTTSRWSATDLRKAPVSRHGWNAKQSAPPVSLDLLGFDPYQWEQYSLSAAFEALLLTAGPEALLLGMEQLDPLDVLALWADLNG